MVRKAKRSLEWINKPEQLPTGKNVVVGIIDTGLDVDRAGVSVDRVVAWDQRAWPADISGVPDSSSLLRGDGVRELTDPTGHGTAIAAIIADRRPPVGLAPDADLRVVLSDGMEDSVIPAIEWIFAQAGSRSAVVNLSIPSMDHADPHDGTDSFSAGISELTGPGRIVCVAVGNDGMRAIHCRLDLGPDEEVDIPVATTFDYSLIPVFSHELVLYSSYATPYEFGVTPLGRRRGPVMVGGTVDCDQDFTDSVAKLSSSANPSIGRQSGSVSISAAGVPPRLGVRRFWRLRVRAGREGSQVDLWGGDRRVEFGSNALGTVPQPEWLDRYASSKRVLARPSAAAGVIAVGAYNDRTLAGTPVWPHSSTGPTRDERARPHFVLPGAGLRTSTGIRSGTSFATALATGIVAGMLERQADLDPADACRLMLGSEGRVDELDLSRYDPSMGCGIVRASHIWKALG
jgi:subtilisin family serine protease